MTADAKKVAAARRHYRVTHWGAAGEYGPRQLLCADPREPLTALGELVNLEYLATKLGDPRNSIYSHSFASVRPVLAYDRTNGKLVIAGGDYRVTMRGIVG